MFALRLLAAGGSLIAVVTGSWHLGLKKVLHAMSSWHNSLDGDSMGVLLAREVRT